MHYQLAVAAALLAVCCGEASDYARGFGDELNWVPWDNARELAKLQRKPVLLLVHKSWCGACQVLKEKMAEKSAQKQLKALAKHFVMTNTEDDEEPWEEEFQPDGKYIPRIVFIGPDGDVLAQKNDKAEYKDYQHYYVNSAQVMQSMRAVMKLYGIEDDSAIVGGAPKESEKESTDSAEKKDDGGKGESKEAETQSAGGDGEAKPPSVMPPSGGAPEARPPAPEKKTEL